MNPLIESVVHMTKRFGLLERVLLIEELGPCLEKVSYVLLPRRDQGTVRTGHVFHHYT